MSLQLTLARAEMRAAEEDWADHRMHCPLCTAAARGRQWDHLCGAGTRCRNRATEAARAVKREQAADKAPLPGQDMLW